MRVVGLSDHPADLLRETRRLARWRAASWRAEFLRLRVSNQSNQQVYDLKVFMEVPPDRHMIHNTPLAPSRKGSPNLFYEVKSVPNPEPGTQVDSVAVECTDAADLRWRREQEGRLHRVPP